MPKAGREIVIVYDEEVAQKLIDGLKAKLDVEGIVTVADYKTAALKASGLKDQEYGWDSKHNIDDAYWKKIPYGVEVQMPKAIPLT